MAVVTLNTRRRAICHNGRIWGYDRNPVAFDDWELRLIHEGLGQMVEGFDGVDRKGRDPLGEARKTALGERPLEVAEEVFPD